MAGYHLLFGLTVTSHWSGPSLSVFCNYQIFKLARTREPFSAACFASIPIQTPLPPTTITTLLLLLNPDLFPHFFFLFSSTRF